jgi:hypothetical protein
MAKPTAASAAATVITKNTNNCPTELPRNDAKAIIVRFAEFNISSIHINTTIAFLLVSTPATPTRNINALRIK